MPEFHEHPVTWDELFSVLRRAAPKLGIYGGDQGGDALKMIAMLRDDAAQPE